MDDACMWPPSPFLGPRDNSLCPCVSLSCTRHGPYQKHSHEASSCLSEEHPGRKPHLAFFLLPRPESCSITQKRRFVLCTGADTGAPPNPSHFSATQPTLTLAQCTPGPQRMESGPPCRRPITDGHAGYSNYRAGQGSQGKGFPREARQCGLW